MRPSVAKVLRRTSRQLSRLLEGEIAGRIPHSVITSIVESSDNRGVAPHLEKVFVEQSSEKIEYDFPANYPISFRREKAFDPVYTYQIRDVVVSPNTGWIWLEPSSLLLQESVGSLHRMVGWGDRLWETRLPTSDGPPEGIVLPWTGYYHWLLEAVPAFLRALRRAPSSAEIILPGHRPPVVDELMSLLNIAPNRRRYSTIPVRVPSMTFSAIPPYSGFVSEDDIERIQSTNPIQSNNLMRSVYVSRRNSAKRKLEGEDRLERELAARGFDVICAERLSLRTQAEVFGSSSLIVAPHGAGLANMIWRSRGECSVLEIFPHQFRNDCYARLATQLGFSYDYVDSRPSSGNFAGRIDAKSVIAHL